MIKNLKRSSLLGEIARINLVPPTRKATALKFNKASFFILPILFLFAFQSVVGQSTVTLEVNWPASSNGNRIANSTGGTLMCDNNDCFSNIVDPNSSYTGTRVFTNLPDN